MTAAMLLPNGTRSNIETPVLVYLLIGALAIIAALVAAGRGVATRVPPWLWGTCAAVMLFLTIVTWGDANEFIYFRF
jgi:hypothetical protein